MESKSLTIIGGGNLGKSIAFGLVEKGNWNASAITVTRRKKEKLKEFEEAGFNISTDNNEAVLNAGIIILAVKPFQIEDILSNLAPKIKEDALLISVASGVSIARLKDALKRNNPIIRAMPNTAIAIGTSMTCVCSHADEREQAEEVIHLFAPLGDAVYIDEELMAAATALGACGIAFALRFIRAATQGGIEIGFSAEISKRIATQTVKGAAELLIQGNQHPEGEIDKVTTPNGCTIVGLNEMEHNGFSSALIRGIKSSYKKI